jgi:hypothetical protein
MRGIQFCVSVPGLHRLAFGFLIITLVRMLSRANVILAANRSA